MASQIARAAAVFSVDEIIIFNDGQSHPPQRFSSNKGGNYHHHDDQATGYTGYSDPDNFLYHVLSYLETPPHLRKSLFPMHANLRTAGAMHSLDMPHHLRANEWCQYREGITIGPANSLSEGSFTTSKKKKNDPFSSSKGESATLIDCGLPSHARVPGSVAAGSRVTVKFTSETEPKYIDGSSPLDAQAVSPDTPREEAGYYWGYSTRLASSLSSVFTECPYDGGYDISIGTSERGIPLSTLISSSVYSSPSSDADIPPIPKDWNHLVLVFGGVAGLEVALKADKELTGKGVTEARDVFDYWVNLVPQQGSRTIRTEEAVWLGLMGLRDVVQTRQDA